MMGQMGNALYYVWFAVLPPILYWIFKIVWSDYATGAYIGNTPYDLLEIVPPRDTEKSPLSMELVLAGLEGVFATPSMYEEHALGMITSPFSFEFAATGGAVRIYARVPRKWHGLFEAHFYAQYPTAELVDVPQDYVDMVPRVLPNKNWKLWGSDIELVAPDPVPIKTWPEFEEDVTGKMLDPLAGLLELMGRTRRGEHMWLQIIAVAQKETTYNSGKDYADALKGKAKAPAKGLIAKLVMLLTGFLAGEGEGGGAKKDESPIEFRLSPVEKKVLQAIEENIGRYMFQVKMRMVYTARNEVYNNADMVSGFFGALKQFADFNLNSFKPGDQSKTKAQYLFKQTRLRFKQRLIIDRYRGRKTIGKKFFLSDRELATVFHMPDMTVVAPAMARTSASQGSAPANLPIRQSVTFNE